MNTRLLFLLLSPSLLWAQSLTEMIRWSLESNTEIKATEITPQVAQHKAEMMQSLDAPTISAEWMNQTILNPMEFKLTAQQMLPWPGKRQVRAELERSIALESKALLPMQKWELSRDVVRAYVDLWSAQEMKKLKMAQWKTWVLAGQNLHLALQNGKAKQADLLKLAQEKSAWRRDSTAVELEILQMKTELQSLTARELSPDFEAQEMKMNAFPPLDSNLLSFRLGMYGAQEKILAQKEKALKAEYKPDLMVGISYQKNFMQKDAYGLMAGVSLPMMPWVSSQSHRAEEIQLDKKLVKYKSQEAHRKITLEWQKAKNQDSLWNLQKRDLEQNSLPRSQAIRTMLFAELSTGGADFREIAETLRMESDLYEQILQLEMQIQMNRFFWNIEGIKP